MKRLDEQALAHIEADCLMGKSFDADTVRLLVEQIYAAREEEYERGYDECLSELGDYDEGFVDGLEEGRKLGWQEAREKILAPSYGDPKAFEK